MSSKIWEPKAVAKVQWESNPTSRPLDDQPLLRLLDARALNGTARAFLRV